MNEISVHAKRDLSPKTAEAIARMVLHAAPEIEYARQAALAPMLVAEIEELKRQLRRDYGK